MDCYYVDKTAHVLRLAREGKYHFLSRPRRFGKSLLVDTFKELFEGNGELFRGLAIHGEWDWSVKHPVVRFDFSGGEFGDPEGLRHAVTRQLDVIGEEAGITPRLCGCAGSLRPSDQGAAPQHRAAGGCACGRVRQADP